MKKIIISITWSGDNYCAGTGGYYGVVMTTGKTLEAVKKEFTEAFQFHIDGCIADGDDVADYLRKGKYELNFKLETSALLQGLSGMLTHSAISRVTGINQRQIGHYATGRSNPRPQQRAKIVEGIHALGKELLLVK